MRKHALIKNNVVIDVPLVDEENYASTLSFGDLLIDIEDTTPQPQINWVLDGNMLVFPKGISDREVLEEELATKKSDFGIKLAKTAVDKIGARNKILNKSGAQVATLLNQLLPIKLLLETGALGTARATCTQLKVIYTEYADIFDQIISEVSRFEQTYGL